MHKILISLYLKIIRFSCIRKLFPLVRVDFVPIHRLLSLFQVVLVQIGLEIPHYLANFAKHYIFVNLIFRNVPFILTIKIISYVNN